MVNITLQQHRLSTVLFVTGPVTLTLFTRVYVKEEPVYVRLFHNHGNQTKKFVSTILFVCVKFRFIVMRQGNDAGSCHISRQRYSCTE